MTNKPGSQTPGQAAQNIKEEVSGTAGSVARGIAGANVTVDSVAPTKPLDDSFVCSCYVTPSVDCHLVLSHSSSVSRPPWRAQYLSLSWSSVWQVIFTHTLSDRSYGLHDHLFLGGLPYLGTAASVIYTARQAGLATAGEFRIRALIVTFLVDLAR